MKHWNLKTENYNLAQIYYHTRLSGEGQASKRLLSQSVRVVIRSHFKQQHFSVIYGKGRVTIITKLTPDKL